MADQQNTTSQPATPAESTPLASSPWDFNITNTTHEGVQVNGGGLTTHHDDQTNVSGHVYDIFANAMAGSEQNTTVSTHGIGHNDSTTSQLHVWENHPADAPQSHLESAPAIQDSQHTQYAVPAFHESFQHSSPFEHTSHDQGGHVGHDHSGAHAGHDQGGGHDHGMGMGGL